MIVNGGEARSGSNRDHVVVLLVYLEATRI